MAPFRLLSIDGGGIRGLIPAIVLAHIEKQTGKPICELFDAIAGTSTGGILALGLTKPGDDLTTRAEKLVKLYQDHGTEIFHENVLRRTFYEVADHFAGDKNPNQHFFGLPRHVALSDLYDPKYAATGRMKVMRDFFGAAKLTDATTRVFVTSYDTYGRGPVFFVSRRADAADERYYDALADDIAMVDAAMATSAAPTYFPPHQIVKPQVSKNEAHNYYSLVDGGVFANNPAALAHSFLNRGSMGPDDFIVSLGTGSMTAEYDYERTRGWGAAQWGFPVLKLMFDGQTEAVALGLERRFGPQHVRLQAFLTDELKTDVSDDLDDASDKNIDAMFKFGSELIEKYQRELDELCKALLARPPESQP
ncbi:MAG TPA: patatin-like phospholipase family protein [Polyangiales bacterium]|nr:patatin-like phospholipase family protein [Polyangiales bacterium]